MSDTPDFVEKFLRKLKQTKTNEEFFEIGEEMKKNEVSKKSLMKCGHVP